MLKGIWKNRRQILEGITNSILVKEEIEQIADLRNDICIICESYDTTGAGCEVPFTQPCCSNLNGGCGCVLHLKQRSLSSSCPKDKWPAILTQEEEDNL